MRTRTILALGCCLVAAACADRNTTQPQEPSFQTVTAGSCPSFDVLSAAITALFPAGNDSRNSALSKLNQVQKFLTKKPAPDSASAKTHAFNLIQFALQKFDAGALNGGQSPATQAALQALLNGVLCQVGLPPAFGTGSLGPDGAAALIFPTTGDTDVVTDTKFGGVHVPANNVTQPTLVVVQRLPDFPGPLLTQLDQYPLYYEYHVVPAGAFINDVTVGLCLAANAAPPDPTRLRLAHNVAPYTPGSIQILPLASAPFVDCTNAPIAMASSRWGFDLAHGTALMKKLFLPAPLLAMATGGVGGTVKEFSPFGAVDTLGTMTATRTSFGGIPNDYTDNVPRVTIKTPNGVPLVGIPVSFQVTSGAAIITGGSTVTSAAGVAAVTSLKLGPTVNTCSQITVTATAPHAGSGIANSPMVMTACTH